MKTNTLALSLTLAASLLAACGGGGDARSPDRPSPGLDPNSLRIEFPLGDQLAGTGSNSIPVRMLALQTDGVDTGLGPELNVTGETQWSLSNHIIDGKIFAERAETVREAAQLGTVLDINSVERLKTTDPDKIVNITGQYTHQGTTRNVLGEFTIKPPIPDGDKFISGAETIAFNPASAEPVTENYQLLQRLVGLTATENTTNSATFCSDNDNLQFGPTTGTGDEAKVPATITNPFTSTNQNDVTVTIKAITKGADCNGNETPIAVKNITIKPAVASKIEICVVTNPNVADTCDTSGLFNASKYLDSCKGLANAGEPVLVPAAQNLQLVAKLTYTNPANAAQAPFVDYQCSAPGALAWSANPTTIFFDGPNSQNGNASLVSRATYTTLTTEQRLSTVTGTYTNSPDAAPVAPATLKLQLVDAEVNEVTIVRADGATSNDDEINLSIDDGFTYIAKCSFVEFGSATPPVNCQNSFVDWSIDQAALDINPESNSNTTTVTPAINASGEGNAILRAQYDDGFSNPDPATRNIAFFESDIEELHLYQVSNNNHGSEDELSIDEFSCVGRTDLIGTVADGATYISGEQHFKAYALLEKDADMMSDEFLADPTAAGSPLIEVTKLNRLVFAAVPGYWSGNSSASPSCVTSALPGLPSEGGIPGADQIPGLDQLPGFDQIPGLPDTSSTPAASFDASGDENKKGILRSHGLLRLSTVCAQAYFDNDRSGTFSEGDVPSIEGSTVLVLPVADDNLLTYSNELCEILEPVLTLGGNFPGLEGPGLVLPLVYTVSTIVDPILTALATNDDGGVIPGEEIVNALITGNFSEINESLPDSPIGGLGQVTSALLGDGSPLSPVISVLDACVADPLTTVVTTLLDALLGLNPDAFGELANIGFDDCQDVFGSFSIPEFPGLPTP